MPPETSKLLLDMLAAARRIETFTSGHTFDDYGQDEMLRSAVERQFEIIGEAMTRLAKLSPETCARITDSRKICGFRNVLIHGYDAVDDAITWGIVQTKLPLLVRELQSIVGE